MIAPIIVPMSTYHGPTDAQIIQEAAFNYSSDPTKQEAFMDGAKFWLHRSECDIHAWQVCLFVYVLLSFVAFLIGTIEHDGYLSKGYLNTPIKILFPAFAIGKFVGKVLFWDFGKK